MKILQVHNRYLQLGGEDQVVAAEKELLLEKGHDVRLFGANNNGINGVLSRVKVAWNASFDENVRRQMVVSMRQWRPDVVHVHNFFPLLTPAVFYACHDLNIPVVMTLHNFRLICPGAFLFRNRRICDECVNYGLWRAVIHRCYKSSFLGTYTVVRMLNYHRNYDTWQKKVQRFIVMTEFSKEIMINAGWTPEKITVKPHFLNIKPSEITNGKREGVLFAGRLSPEKGLKTLLKAWEKIDYPLILAGDGPLRNYIETQKNPNIRLVGWLSSEELAEKMDRAAYLVVPSEWYETFGMVVIEAFSRGLPVIASRIGSLAELVEDGKTGTLFEPGNPDDLKLKILSLILKTGEVSRMGNEARRQYLKLYTPEKNYSLLMEIYDGVRREA